ncbi:hypothetical protein NADFUDRAFT_82827 [Nadsonia fulvescens var. elongata DSM 6958]|uniref:Nudix hydrolase domain-containing protein n=1 Tax=Nadsonia fulvescens var. elongata DSM 6958 TaxID=857566 RepID=A0A1E3PL25_9ASCO|nr:hypothetical protein NADFUDRAFT_82827 [Nadsonia fulvescens var. elongata DSM 6958]
MSRALKNALMRLRSLQEVTFTSKQPTLRASLALILRFVPRKPNNLPVDSIFDEAKPLIQKNLNDLSVFFNTHPESQYDAELLFIKRASRHTDRWSGQIAFPGGRRDPEDDSDLAACIREVREEVGIDLSKNNANSIYIGSLAQKPVMSQFGYSLTMILCPYVFILTDPKKFKLDCQAEEVAGAFWVPLDQLNEELTSPRNRDLWQPVDFSHRLQFANKSIKWIPNWIYHVIGSHSIGTGDMLFPAINLSPTEFKASIDSSTVLSQLPVTYFRLWGLSNGIVTDLLEFINPRSIIPYIRWPTFENRDFRAIISILSAHLKWKKRQELNCISQNYNNVNLDIYGHYLNGYFKYIIGGIGLGFILRTALLIFVSSVCLSIYQIFCVY